MLCKHLQPSHLHLYHQQSDHSQNQVITVKIDAHICNLHTYTSITIRVITVKIK